MSETRTNPPLVRTRPAVDRLHAAVHRMGAPAPAPEWTPFDPDLTPGQDRVLTAELPRLFRLLDARDDRRRLANLAAVLVILDDLHEQVPAVDEALREQRVRDRLPGGADRRRPSQLLTKRAR
jgi:hypothetical protein